MVDGLVSTIIPVYNRAHLLREAVDSVLAQSYEQIEIIVVDDGSTEPSMANSLEECCRKSEGKVRIVQQPNQGPGAARQHGLDHAKGEFVQFLDSDDLLYPRKFASQVAMLRQHPSADVAYGKTRNAGLIGHSDMPWKKTGEEITHLFPTLLAGRIWDTSTPLYRTLLVREVGGWTNLINEEDWEFDCRIAAQGVQLAWVDEWVSEQRACASNRTSKDGSSEPKKLIDRAKARHLILESALRAEVPIEAPEFQTFLRYSFLLARQCAAAGLDSEADKLVRHLNEVSPRKLMGLYLLAGKWIGFQRTTRFAERAHRLLRPNHRRMLP